MQVLLGYLDTLQLHCSADTVCLGTSLGGRDLVIVLMVCEEIQIKVKLNMPKR